MIEKENVMRIWIAVTILVAGITCDGTAQVVRIVDAEACEVRTIDGRPTAIFDSVLAGGTRKVGDFWGEKEGDEISWELKLDRIETQLKLAVRYSYHESHYREFTGYDSAERKLMLLMDGEEVGWIEVLDTGSWEDFDTAYVRLPRLSSGPHQFTLRSPTDRVTTDLDAFTFFRGDPEEVLTPAWRRSMVTKSPDGRFTLRMTARAVVQHEPEAILRYFDHIYDYYHEYMGWDPDRGVTNIHIYEDALGQGTFENQHGIYFEASNFNTDRGNWIHEMNHVFDSGLFPHWSGHPMIRFNDTFVTGPEMFPGHWRIDPTDRLAVGRKVLASRSYRTDDPHEILYALRVKYGKDLLRRFYRECREAKERGEIEFVRAHPLTRDQYIDLMSRAAGDDVRRYFEQWNGFANAQ